MSISTLTCFVIGKDPIVRMDIQETILRHFPEWTVIVLAQLDHLDKIAERADGARIFIAAAEPQLFVQKLESIDSRDPASAIVVTGGAFPEVPSRIPYQVLPKPFGMEQLLKAVETALSLQQ